MPIVERIELAMNSIFWQHSMTVSGVEELTWQKPPNHGSQILSYRQPLVQGRRAAIACTYLRPN